MSQEATVVELGSFAVKDGGSGGLIHWRGVVVSDKGVLKLDELPFRLSEGPEEFLD